MANNLLTINMLTREAVRLWKNTNAFIQNIDTQYDDSFAKTGAKIGTALRIRLPNDYTVTNGPAASVQDTAEQSTTMTLATQRHVDVSFSSVDRTMSLDDFSKRILAPMVNNLAGNVAQAVMAGSEGGICNFTANQDGSYNILNPNQATYLNGGAILDINSAPVAMRKVLNSPITEARMVSTLSGLLNPATSISRQYTTGRMYDALGFDWMKDQTAITHTTGTAGQGDNTVVGADQTGLTLVTAAQVGTFVAGDIIEIAGVNAVNRITKATTGTLRQFVVTDDSPVGSTLLNIYPALIPGSTNPAAPYDPTTGDNAIQYQTVDYSPATGAAINPAQGLAASTTYRKNFAFAPDAVTLATADLEMPRGVHEAAREAFDGCAMRFVSAYNIATDNFISRLDILFGYLWIRPEWAVIVADVV